ncbi:MAG: hypothetical protein GY786_21945 [Proteobacteria bacterium]|nr:hypothetical protein [Pseudomonadota bacterium]
MLETFSTILPYIAMAVVIMLFSIPQIWGAVFTFSLLGHLSQFLTKKKNRSITR